MRVLILTYFSFFFAATSFAQKISFEAFKEEIEITKSVVTDLHPEPFAYQPEKKLEELCDSLLQQNIGSDSISILGAFRCYAHVVSSIKCAHSGAYLPKKIDSSLNRFPFDVRILDEQVYIGQEQTAYESIKFGDQIISINGISVKTLFNQGITLHSSAGLSQLSIKRFERSFGSSIAVLLKNPSSYSITINRDDKDTLTLNVKPHPYKKPEKPSNSFKFEIKKHKGKKIALFSIHHFPSYEESFEFEKFCNRSIKKIRSTSIKNVVIDLRDNGGGDYSHFLLRYFASHSFNKTDSRILRTEHLDKYKTKIITYNLQHTDSLGYYLNPDYFPMIDYQGKMKLNVNLFVLVNNYTASAASQFTALVKEHDLGLIAGSETGGKFSGNNGTAYMSYFLPQSGVEIYLPLAKNIFAVDQTTNRDHGVIPDIKIKPQLNKEEELLQLMDKITEYYER